MRNSVLVGRKFREFFFPTVLMSASASLSLIIDSMIVGNVLGDSELAAMNLIMPVSLCFTAISGLFGVGAATGLSLFRGRMEEHKAHQCFTLATLAWAVCSVLVVLLGLFASDRLAAAFSGTSGLTALVEDYLRVYLLGAPMTFATLIFPHILKANGRPKLASNGLIVANVTNLVLDIVFMELLQMELDGAALATVTGNAVGVGIYLVCVLRTKNRTLRLVRICLADLKLYGQMLRLSVSSILGQAFMVGKMWIFNMIVAAAAGQAGLTAFSVCTSCLSFVSMFIAGGAQTMIPMVSAFRGAEDFTAIRMTVRKAFQTILLCCIAVTVLFELFPQTVMGLYGVTGGEALELGVRAIRLFSLSLTGIGFNFMYMYYVQASGMAAFSLQICALEGFFIIVPMGLLLGAVLGINGIWLAYSVNALLVIGFILLRARYTARRSQGRLTGLFLLEQQSQTLELSVDVSDAAQLQAAADTVARQLGQPVEERVLAVLQLSARAYEQRRGLKKGDSADLLLRGTTLHCKDLGQAYTKELGDAVAALQAQYPTYAVTNLIGMNYSTVELGGGHESDTE